jgi:hypothetical protein
MFQNELTSLIITGLYSILEQKSFGSFEFLVFSKRDGVGLSGEQVGRVF